MITLLSHTLTLTQRSVNNSSKRDKARAADLNLKMNFLIKKMRAEEVLVNEEDNHALEVAKLAEIDKEKKISGLRDLSTSTVPLPASLFQRAPLITLSTNILTLIL